MKTLPGTLALALALVLAVNPLAGVAAQEANIALHLDRVDTSAFPTVTVYLSAWEASGLPLSGLSITDFSLQEDGGSQVPIQGVQADPKAPLQVALLIDVSGSMQGEPLDDAKQAAARFLDRLESGDQAALIAFSEPVDPDPAQLNPRRELPFSGDLAPVYDLIDGLESGGGTYLYNALTKAVRMASEQPAGHRAMLLLSDGRNDPPSVGDPEQPIQLLKEANVPVFVIGLGDLIDEPYLRRLANESGGLFRAAPRSSELAQLFDDMATLLKTQYRLTYTSQLPADGKDHTLNLTLNAAGESVTESIEFGPLPSAPAATDTPVREATSTPLPMPSATPLPPTATTIPAPTATAIPIPTPVPSFMEQVVENPLSWLLVALILVGGGGWFLFSRRKPRPQPEVCARCGFDLTGKSGACPQCGETRRLPKGK